MKILKIAFQNFKSYGNKKVTLDFEKEFNNKLVLLSGLNGFGKSTLKEVFEFAAYGRVDGFTLSDLPNRTNRALYVYIKFLAKGKKIEIERGISPSVFKLKINGRDYDEAGKKNIQAYIENELFEIPYHIFKNTMALSINNFKSFLTMTPKDKREIIDRIFGFDILNK
jgi:DNA repair exonuclease SbcCD ATPase subunit